MSAETGLVLVLVPGGTFLMGSQLDDPDGANYDPMARTTEGPVHGVTLDAFFISKFEMTQAQWARLSGDNPSQWGPDVYDARWNAAGEEWSGLHPIENVSWYTATTLLARAGLELPTESQWEYAARAGTTTPWYTGPDRQTLIGHANLNDEFSRVTGNGYRWSPYDTWLDDGQTVHAAVGSFAPNPFGLHDVHGNVWEWCQDFGGRYVLEIVDASGRRGVSTPARLNRVYRGGSFINQASEARSAYREDFTPIFQTHSLGVRPARAIASGE